MGIAELLQWLPLIVRGIPAFVDAYNKIKSQGVAEPTPAQVQAIMDGVEEPVDYSKEGS